MTKIFSLRDQKYFPAVTRKLNKIFFIKNLAPQMSYAVILVAWLAMMPQLMPKQRTDFFDWAMSTLLPAVTLVLEGGNPCAQLGACLALVPSASPPPSSLASSFCVQRSRCQWQPCKCKEVEIAQCVIKLRDHVRLHSFMDFTNSFNVILHARHYNTIEA